MAFSKLMLSIVVTNMIALGSSHDLFGFVRDETCEFYGMNSIHDAVQCESAALLISQEEGLRTDTQFLCKTQWDGDNLPTGCSYHQFGNIELWGETTGDCDVNGFGGCFCIKDKFAFVQTGTCESNGMQSIREAAVCKRAADTIAESEGLRTDTQFLCKTQWDGDNLPTGCSYHQFGNIELWGETTGDCDVNGFGGCFCIKDKFAFVQTGTCESNGMQSIREAAVCKRAADTIAESEGLRTDTQILCKTQWDRDNLPTGC
eukprot:386503_1